MATTYTEHLKLRKPEIGQPSWGDEMLDNIEIQDFIAGGYKAGNRVITGCAPSDGGGLVVDYAGGEVSVDGSRHTITAGSKTCNVSTKNWLCVDATGTVQLYTTAPINAYAALAMIDTSDIGIDRIADCRQLAEGAAAFDLAYTPDNYLPDTGQTKEIEQHLAGIDNQLGFMTGFKNKVINGGFDIWQRGTSQTTAGYGADDRWYNYDYGDGSFVCSRQSFEIGQTDVPGNPKYYSRTVVTAGVNTNSSIRKYQNIENVCLFSGQTVTLSFWAKADAVKNIATRWVQYFGSGGTPSASIGNISVTTHNLSTDWQEFTQTVTLPSVAGKTLGTDNNDYTRIEFIFDAGSDYNDDSNFLGHQSGTFDIAQVQIEKGEVKTPFEQRLQCQELQLCRRYYQKLGATEAIAFGSTGNSNVLFFEIVLAGDLRDLPDVQLSGFDFRFGGTSFTVNTSNITDIVNQPHGIRIGTDVTGGGANTGGYTCINIGSAEFNAEQ